MELMVTAHSLAIQDCADHIQYITESFPEKADTIKYILEESTDGTMLKVRLYRYAIKNKTVADFIKDLVAVYVMSMEELEAHNLPPNWSVSL